MEISPQFLDMPTESVAAANSALRLAEEKRDKIKSPGWIKNNPPSLKLLRKISWWKKARRKVVGLKANDNGEGCCKIWTNEMFDAICKNRAELTNHNVRLQKRYSRLRDHWWLEMHQGGLVYIFDGTIYSQRLDRKLRQGFYGEKHKLAASLAPDSRLPHFEEKKGINTLIEEVS